MIFLSLRSMGQAQSQLSREPSLLPLDTIRLWMAEGRYEAAMAENRKLKQRMAALDVLVDWLARPEDGVQA